MRAAPTSACVHSTRPECARTPAKPFRQEQHAYLRNTRRYTFTGLADVQQIYAQTYDRRQHQTNTSGRIRIRQRRALFVPTSKTLPEEHTTDMVYPARKTTTTHASGTEIPKIRIEDDLRHPNAAKKNPAELPRGTGYTDFAVRLAHDHITTLPILPKTNTHSLHMTCQKATSPQRVVYVSQR